MSQATQDLVIRMKTDSQNFNEGIDKAKKKVGDFKREGQSAGDGFKSGMAAAKAAIGKIAIAVAAATAAIKTYKSFAEQTQTLGDNLNNTISACKDTWNALQREMITGGDATVSKLREIYREAKKLADLRDALGTDVIARDVYGMKYKTAYEEARTEYQEAKKKGDEKAMVIALRKATKALNDYESANQILIRDSQNAVLKGISIAINGMDLESSNALDELVKVSEAQQGQLMGITQTYKHFAEMSKDDARDYFGKLYTNPARYGTAGVEMEPVVPTGHAAAKKAMKDLGYSDKQIEMAERQYRMSQINDPTYQQIKQDLATGIQMENEIISMRRGLVRMQEKETPTNTNTPTYKEPTPRKEVETIPELKPRTMADIEEEATFKKMMDLRDELIKREHEGWVKLEMDQEDLLRQEQMRLFNLNMFASGLSTLSNVFSNLASMATNDSPWKKFMNVLSSVSSGIMSVVQTYTSLIAALTAAEVIKSGEGIPFPYNLIVMAAAAASITGIIASVVSQAKSTKFAQGGIVGGNDYHDGIHANLSTGEMVLNKNQQARLWAMIQSGGGGGKAENVVFKIAGEDLVGVIDNYNKNINY